MRQNVKNQRPLRNRVDPWGVIVATNERGSLFGNRGVLHDATGTLVRSHQVRRWISCELEFKNRRRPLLRPGHYTELFFLDEPTALAAGHRPCFECRRADAVAFQSAWREAFALDHIPRVAEMDDVIHEARLGPKPMVSVRDLPTGAMVGRGERAWLVGPEGLRSWDFSGYGPVEPAAGEATLLTPMPIVHVLRAGFQPRR